MQEGGHQLNIVWGGPHAGFGQGLQQLSHAFHAALVGLIVRAVVGARHLVVHEGGEEVLHRRDQAGASGCVCVCVYVCVSVCVCVCVCACVCECCMSVCVPSFSGDTGQSTVG